MAGPWENYQSQETAPQSEAKPWEKYGSQSMTAGEVARQAIENFPRSAVELGQSIIDPFLHPIETAQTLGRTAVGLTQKLTPPRSELFAELGIPQEQYQAPDLQQYPEAVWNTLAERYGGMENLKRTIAEDPAGVMADAAAVATGGAGLLRKVPGAVGRVAERVSNPIRMPQRGAPVPGLEDLRAAAKKSYEAASQSGVTFGPARLTTLSNDIFRKLRSEGFSPKLHPKVAGAMEELESAAGNVNSFGELETQRRIAKAAAKSLDPDEARLGSMMVEEIDNFIDNLKPSDVTAGNPIQAAKAIKEARSNWAKLRKGEEVEDLIQRARDSLSQFSASGFENAIRTEFRKFVKNKKRMRYFTPVEQRSLRRVSKGGPISNLLRDVGRFAPTGPVSGMLVGGGATIVGGPWGLVAASGVTHGARWAATQLTKGRVRKAGEVMRRGGPPPMSKVTKTEDILRGLYFGGQAEGAAQPQ